MEHAPELIPALIVLSLFLLSGILALTAAIANWEWFFNSKNCRMLTTKLSRRQARWLYGIIGGLILLMTIVIAADMLPATKTAREPLPQSERLTPTSYLDNKISTNVSGKTILSTPIASANNGAMSSSPNPAIPHPIRVT